MWSSIETQINAIIDDIKSNSSSDENPRVKAIVITKLQEAWLFSREIYNKDF